MQSIKATYKNGVFTPQQPIELADGSKVTIWLEPAETKEVDHLRDEDREFLKSLATERAEVFRQLGD